MSLSQKIKEYKAKGTEQWHLGGQIMDNKIEVRCEGPGRDENGNLVEGEVIGYKQTTRGSKEPTHGVCRPHRAAKLARAGVMMSE